MILLTLAAASETCFTETATLSGDAYKLELYLLVTQAREQNAACANFENSSGLARLYLAVTLPNGTDVLVSEPIIYSNLRPQTFTFNMAGTSQADFNYFIKTQHISYAVEIGISRPMTGAISRIEYSKSDISSCWSSIDFEYSITAKNYYFALLTQPNFCQFTGYLKAKLRYSAIGLQTAELPYFISSDAPNEYNINYDHENTFKFALSCTQFSGQDLERCTAFFELLEQRLDIAISLVLEYNENGVDLEIIGEVGEYYAEHSKECFALADPDVDIYEDMVVVSLVQLYNLTDCVVSDFDAVDMQLYMYNAKSDQNYVRTLTPIQYTKDIIFAVEGNFSEFFALESRARFRFLLRKGDQIVHAVVREQRGRVFCVYQMEAKLRASEIDVFLRYYPHNETCRAGKIDTTVSFNFYRLVNEELVLLGRSKVDLQLDFNYYKIQPFVFKKDDFKFTYGDFDSVMRETYYLAKDKKTLIDVYNSLFFIYSTNVFIYGTKEFTIVMACVMALMAAFAVGATLFVYGVCGKQESVTL